MKIKYIIVFVLFLISSLQITGSPHVKTGTVRVSIYSIKSDKGNVLIALYNSSSTFMCEQKALQRKVLTIEEGKAIAVFQDVPYGNYAFAVFHDENVNYKLDKTLVGVPKEGYGFSNNAQGTFGPPSFDKSQFTLNSINYQTVIRLQYFFR
ncbi:MAG: DUF2141 domain-containing protein [Bacteroidia bacterium]|nr:DUF2141 domain-containing protein [Bacteroidia bacterium]